MADRIEVQRHPGEVFGPYEVVRRIARGSMGAVYRGVHRPTGRDVALKFPHLLPAKDMPGYLRRFHDEARLAIEITHPNIVKVYEVAVFGENHFMVMEFVEGRTLDGILEERPVLPVAAAVDFTIQVARALEEIHNHDVVHRDVKPSNVILDATGRARLLDFGVAKMRDRERDAAATAGGGEIVGTPHYIPPEQSRGMRADHRADIYSLGVSLFRMLAGRVPYTAKRRAELFQMILDAPVPSIREFNPSVPERLDAVVRRAMSKEPERRQNSTAELIAELGGVVDQSDLFE